MSDIIDAKSQTGHDLPGFVTPDGQVRLLAALPNKGTYKFTPYRAANPVLNKSEIKSFARVRKDVPILNQGQVGSCNPHGATSANMRARSIAGQVFLLLSASDLYAQINGGHDQGSVPEDAANSLTTRGQALDSEIPEGFYTAAQIARKSSTANQTAARFKADPESFYQIDSYEELYSAIALDFCCFFTVRVAGNWNNFDANGSPPFRPGYGNHVTSDDNSLEVTSGGDIIVPSRNSWDYSWGNNGRYNYTNAAWDNQPGAVGYAMKFPGQDPLDPNLVPAAN